MGRKAHLLIPFLVASLVAQAQVSLTGRVSVSGTVSTGAVIFNANFEDGSISPMKVGTATCSIDNTTGANGTSKSVLCTCAYTSAGTTACSGGGGQSEITYRYVGTDPGWSGTVWESWWMKTDAATVTAASDHSSQSDGQIKLHLLRSGNVGCGSSKCPWMMLGMGFTFANQFLRMFFDDFTTPHPVTTSIDLSDGQWHRIVQKRRQSGGLGCATVWVDDMVTPKFGEFCEATVGSSGANYDFRIGIPYGEYGGSSNGTYNVWVDEVVSATYDIR